MIRVDYLWRGTNMNAYMTNGTVDFLETLANQHPEYDFFIMNSVSSTIAYYEDEGQSVFNSGREYEILIKKGEIQLEGVVVMNTFPLTAEGSPLFIDRFQKNQSIIESFPGFQAFRLLKPAKGHVFVILTQWASERDFEIWKDSDAFAQLHDGTSIKPPAYLPDKPYMTKYSMHEKDE